MIVDFRMGLFVAVMAVGGEDINVDFCFKNPINNAVFFGYLPTPAVFGLAFKRLGVTSACFGMYNNLIEQLNGLFKTFGFIPFQFCKVGFGFGRI